MVETMFSQSWKENKVLWRALLVNFITTLVVSLHINNTYVKSIIVANSFPSISKAFEGKNAFDSHKLPRVLLMDSFNTSVEREIIELTSKPPSRMSLKTSNEKVVMDNGIIRVSLSKPNGLLTKIRYNGIHNLLDERIHRRGYWDVNWINLAGGPEKLQNLEGNQFEVITYDVNKLEISFRRIWNISLNDSSIPLNVDIRYVMLSGSSGIYSYAILEHCQEWPAFQLFQLRIALKLPDKKFNYMALSDTRQRPMPTTADRKRGLPLAYPEAVLLTHPSNPSFKGEVDDKYQYSSDNRENRVHGWISSQHNVGLWMITPSDEFRTGGPLKQDLTSHVGATTLAMFISTHYSGEDLGPKFGYGEAWKKVFGPVFIYLNSVSNEDDPNRALWEDAKHQMNKEVESWPYSFPSSPEFVQANQRGTVEGRLLIKDGDAEVNISAHSAYVGLALPGDAGSWQTECKGYQFWVKSDENGTFFIPHILPGSYNLYAWVPGYIGDYKYNVNITIDPGNEFNLGDLLYEPPRDGPTLWEIGIPDRSAAEFYIPDPYPSLENQLYVRYPQDKFRQYGLWERYTDLYPNQDLIYHVGIDNCQTDWFFAHVSRKKENNTYEGTTWQIVFQLNNVTQTGLYKLRLAIAAASYAELQVRVNDPGANPPHFTTGRIGRDNAIARHGIHGLYWLYNVDVLGTKLIEGNNTIFLLQSRCSTPFEGLMYDYIRLEGLR